MRVLRVRLGEGARRFQLVVVGARVRAGRATALASFLRRVGGDRHELVGVRRSGSGGCSNSRSRRRRRRCRRCGRCGGRRQGRAVRVVGCVAGDRRHHHGDAGRAGRRRVRSTGALAQLRDRRDGAAGEPVEPTCTAVREEERERAERGRRHRRRCEGATERTTLGRDHRRHQLRRNQQLLERGAHLGGVGEALARGLLHRPRHQLLERLRQRADDRRHRLGLLAELLAHHHHRDGPQKGRLPVTSSYSTQPSA